MEKYINSKGKQIIGWDEILEGGLAPNATVMSWRGMKGGIEAATQGHDVIMTPGSHCYFDHYQSDSPNEPLAIGGFTSLEKVYNFNPIPPSLSGSEAKHILGAQGNVWTEYMKTPEKVAYMIFPRILALSEVIWSGNQNKDYDLFVKIAEEHLYQLKKEGINVANHLSDIKAKIKSGEGNGVTLNCITESSSNTIHYTTDDFNLNNKSKLFPENLKITESQKIKVQAFSNGTKKGNGVTIDFKIHKAAGKKIALINAPSPKYNTGGKGALINGILGNPKRYGDTEWLGFEGKDCIGIIDFDKKTTTNSISIRFFNGKGQWIYPPKNIEVLGSNDGNSFKLITDYKLDSSNDKIVPVTLKYPASNYQFLKIWIHRHGIIAEGKQGGGHEAWLFVDEIVVE